MNARRRTTLRAALVLLQATTVGVVTSSCAQSARPLPTAALTQRFDYRQIHMGVAVELSVYAVDEAAARAACTDAFACFARLENVMSDYRPGSELSRLSARAGTGPVDVSETLFDVLSRAQQFAGASGGAFDVTCGPAVQLWRAARKSGTLPKAAALEAARRSIGFDKLRLDADRQTVDLAAPGMRLDLGGIGKGYAADEALKVLLAHGITSALIQAGGDVLASAPPPGKAGWTFDPGGGRTTLIHDTAVSTSGDSEQFVILGGVRYSHIVDPRTARALTTHAQAVVYAPESTTADALSTALTVLDPAGATRLLACYPRVRADVTR